MQRVVAVLLVLSLTLTGCLRDMQEPGPSNRLDLRGIDVAAPHVSSGSVRLEVNTTLDNAEADSEPIRLVVKAFDSQTGFLVRTETTPNRTLGEDTTRSLTVELDVPRRSGYRIEVQVYEGGRLVETGQVTVRNLAALEPTAHETALAIQTMEFMVRNVSDARVRIETQVYLTNEGSDVSRELRMQVKARDVQTGLLADERYVPVPRIPAEETHILPVDLEVPDRHNYRVEAVLWDGNLTVERGQGAVQLLPTMRVNASEDIVVSEPRIEDFVRSGDHRGDRAIGDRDERSETAETPGPGAVAVVALIGAVAVAWTRRRWT